MTANNIFVDCQKYFLAQRKEIYKLLIILMKSEKSRRSSLMLGSIIDAVGRPTKSGFMSYSSDVINDISRFRACNNTKPTGNWNG